MGERLKVEMALDGVDAKKFLLNGMDLLPFIGRGIKVEHVQDQAYEVGVTVKLLVTDLVVTHDWPGSGDE